jgi:hypothetical protein
MMRLPTPSHSGHRWGFYLSNLEKAEALANSLETRFHPVTDPSSSTVIQMVDVALRFYFLTPASEFKLTNPEDVHEDIKVLVVSKAPGPNGIPKRTLKHLPREWYPSSPRFTTRFSAPITILNCRSTLV